jgi:hypothetical protein
MHPFGGTTCEMIAQQEAEVIVVPLFVDYGPDASLVEFGTPRTIGDPEELHLVGEEIAALGNRARAAARVDHPGVARFDGLITYPGP